MQKIHLADEATQSIFDTMFRKRNLIPIIGAGFTKEAHTEESVVPDGDAFRRIMLECLAIHVGPDAASLNNKQFSEIAQYFLDPEFVPREVAKSIIRKYFVGVKIDGAQHSFLDCPWPYIYTLNIDDAIETNSKFINKVVPNRTIAGGAKTMLCVYKVHGDAADEILYDEPSRIIFSTGQYIKSLTTNKSMLDLLKTDLTEQNTLFLGCSLFSEIDLLFALAEYQGPFIEGRRSIYVTQDQPDRFALAKLASHGINTILHIDSYKSFYQTISSWAKQSVALTPALRAPLQLKPAAVQKLGMDRSKNLSFLLREAPAQTQPYECVLPAYTVGRDIEDAVMTSIEASPLLMIRGRRFSGRTLLLRNVAAKTVAKDVYYIDSSTRVSDDMLSDLTSTKNSLLLFDTNSLTASTAYMLAKRLDALKSNGTSAVVAVNRTEPDVQGTLMRVVDDRDEYELDSRFSPRELALMNSRLDAIGLSRFTARQTLLENTFQSMRRYPTKVSQLSKLHTLSEREAELLLVVAISDKAYSSLATILDIRIVDLISFCDKLSPIIDIVETRRGELADTHSRYKVVVNSSTGLALLMRSVIDGHGYKWLAERFAVLVSRLLGSPQFGEIAHTMYMFDAINQVLSQGADSGTGYRPVVRTLYQELQGTLGASPDYWLQRAKASLNIEDREEDLLDGINFATKAFHDAERERTKDNAEFLMALLFGKLCAVTEYKKIEYVVSATRCFTRAIRNRERNTAYVQTMLEQSRTKKGLFDQLCDYLEEVHPPIELLQEKRDVDFLLSVRRSWNQRPAPR